MSMPSTTCEHCGAALPGCAPEGLCPRCLMESAVRLAVSDAEPGQPVSAASAPAPGRPLAGSFGNYELLDRIAAGGMGVVYKARQLGLNRIVAIKLLPFGPFTREEFIQRFQLEAGAAAKLRHPNIVTIHDVGRADGYPFFSMEYVEGQTLAELVRNSPLPVERAVRLVRAIAEAVHYAHQQGILHRDLKPSNVLVDALDQPRVTDFGLARDLAHDSDLTLTGQALGSPNFMPPEQAEGRRGHVSPRSDVYGLGAILYFLLSGRPPFVGDSPVATLRQVTHHEPVTPRLLNPALPRDLETICLRCLEKEPARRYATAQEVADELGRFQRSEPIVARPAGVLERTWRWCRRQPIVAGLLALLWLVLVAGFTGTLWQWRRAERNAARFAESVTRLEIERAEDRLMRHETSDGLAALARVLRREPGHQPVAYRILSVLGRRDFVRPAPLVIQDDFVGRNSAWAQHGHWLVTATNNASVLQLWDTRGECKLARLLPCPAPVRVSSFRHDGAQLVAATAGGDVLVFDVTQGVMVAGPHATGAYIDRVLLSPAGREIIVHISGSGSDDWRKARVRVLDAESGSWRREEPAMHWAAFSPDGRLLITAEGSLARLRNATSWEPIGDPVRHASRVNMAEFSPDSLWVITAAADRTARLCRVGDPQGGAVLRHGAQVLSACFSANGHRVLTADITGNGQLWDIATGSAAGSPFKLSRVFGADSFSKDGSLVVAHEQDKVWLRDASNGALLAETIEVGHRVTRARFVGEGRRLITSTFGGTAQQWEIIGGRSRELHLPHRGELIDAVFSPDGSLIVTAARERSSQVWHANTGEAVSGPLIHQGQVLQAAFSPDGRRVVTACVDGTARVWNFADAGSAGAALDHAGPVRRACFSPDGRWLVTVSEDKTGRLWDAKTLRPFGDALVHKDHVVWAAFSPDSTRVATVSHDNTARLWRVPDGTPASVPLVHANWVNFALFRPDGRWIATCSADRTARFWDVATGREAAPAVRHEAKVNTVCFDATGERVVTASDDGTAQLWNATTGRALTRGLPHDQSVEWAEFSPDGRFVVTASADRTARIWDAATGHAVSDPLRHDGTVVSARWNREGTAVLTASYDRTARVWPADYLIDAPPPAWLPELAETIAGKRVGRNGVAERVDAAGYFPLKQSLLDGDASSPWRFWLERFFADQNETVAAERQPSDGRLSRQRE